jgi:hypothetical protein
MIEVHLHFVRQIVRQIVHHSVVDLSVQKSLSGEHFFGKMSAVIKLAGLAFFLDNFGAGADAFLDDPGTRIDTTGTRAEADRAETDRGHIVFVVPCPQPLLTSWMSTR